MDHALARQTVVAAAREGAGTVFCPFDCIAPLLG